MKNTERKFIRSETLFNALESLDGDILRLEADVTYWNKLWKERDAAYNKLLDEQIRSGQQNMANILAATLNTAPSLNIIGPAGAIVLLKIKEMETIEQVKAYLDSILEASKADSPSPDQKTETEPGETA